MQFTINIDREIQSSCLLINTVDNSHWYQTAMAAATAAVILAASDLLRGLNPELLRHKAVHIMFCTRMNL